MLTGIIVVATLACFGWVAVRVGWNDRLRLLVLFGMWLVAVGSAVQVGYETGVKDGLKVAFRELSVDGNGVIFDHPDTARKAERLRGAAGLMQPGEWYKRTDLATAERSGRVETVPTVPSPGLVLPPKGVVSPGVVFPPKEGTP